MRYSHFFTQHSVRWLSVYLAQMGMLTLLIQKDAEPANANVSVAAN